MKDHLGATDRETLHTRILLAKQLQRDGQVVEATEIVRTTVERQTQVLGDEHPDTLTASSELARLLWEGGERRESEALRAQVLATALRVFGEGEPITQRARGDLLEFDTENGEEVFGHSASTSTQSAGDSASISPVDIAGADIEFTFNNPTGESVFWTFSPTNFRGFSLWWPDSVAAAPGR